MLTTTRFADTLAKGPVTFNRAVRLQGARDVRLQAVSGLAWITVDGELRDIVLAPGQSVLVDSDRPVLVAPLIAGQSMQVEARRPCAPAARRQTWRPAGGWVQRLRGWMDSHVHGLAGAR